MAKFVTAFQGTVFVAQSVEVWVADGPYLVQTEQHKVEVRDGVLRLYAPLDGNEDEQYFILKYTAPNPETPSLECIQYWCGNVVDFEDRHDAILILPEGAPKRKLAVRFEDNFETYGKACSWFSLM